MPTASRCALRPRMQTFGCAPRTASTRATTDPGRCGPVENNAALPASWCPPTSGLRSRLLFRRLGHLMLEQGPLAEWV